MSSMLGGLLIDWNELWWNVCKGLLYIVDIIGKSLNFVLGVTEVSSGDGGITTFNDTITNIFKNLFAFDGSGTLKYAYGYIMIIAISFMAVFGIIGVIKAVVSKESVESLGKMVAKGVFSIAKMIIIPLVFLITLQLVGIVFNILLTIMSGGTDTSSLAQQVCNACVAQPKDKPPINILFDMDYKAFVSAGGKVETFNFTMCILASAFCVVTLATCVISLIKRILEVFFYYLTAPMVLARSMIDDGKSYELWKDNFIAKLLGAGGIIISLYLFYAVLPVFSGMIDGAMNTQDGMSDSVGNFLKIIFICGASTVPASGTMMLAQLISQGAGQNEASNLGHSQQMMGNAMRLATGLGGKAVVGGLMGSGGGAASSAFSGLSGVANGLSAGLKSPSSGGITAMGQTSGSFGGGGVALGGAVTRGMMGAATTLSGGGTLDSSAKSIDPSTTNVGSVPGIGALTPNQSGNLASVGESSAIQNDSKSGGGFRKEVGNNLKKAWDSGKKNQNATMAYLGFAGMAGSFLARNGKRLAGVLTSVPKAAIKSIKGIRNKDGFTLGERTSNYFGKTRQTKHDIGLVKQQLREQALGNQSKEAKSSNKRLNFMDRELGNYQKKAEQVENKLFTPQYKKLPEEQRNAYRNAMLGATYKSLQGRLNSVEQNMDKANPDIAQRVNRFNELNPQTYRPSKPKSEQ